MPTSDDRASQQRHWLTTPGLVPCLLAVATAFGGWSLLLPVVPRAVIDQGGSPSLAGATTGVFMAATVLTQIFTPRLTRIFGYVRTMMVSALLLGGPALLYILLEDSFSVLAISAVRGCGFGALTVAQSALIAELAPRRYLGKASGMLGVAIGASQVIFFPLGLELAHRFGTDTAYLVAAAVALSGVLLCLRIPRLYPQSGANAAIHSSVPTLLRRYGSVMTVSLLSIGSVAAAFGGISALLAPAVEQFDPRGAQLAGIALGCVGAAQMVSRYAAGMLADRTGTPGLLVLPALISASAGVGVLIATLVLGAGMWWIFAGALFFGAGFGAIQNEALLLLFRALPRSRVGHASALWNMAFDTGTGAGSFALGVVAASTGYWEAFAFGIALMALSFLAIATQLRSALRHA